MTRPWLLWLLLLLAACAFSYVVLASLWPAESVEPCAAYALGWDGVETCPSAFRREP